MAQYWEIHLLAKTTETHPSAQKTKKAKKATRDLSGAAELPLLKCGQLLKDFHQHRERLARQDKTREAKDWQSELRLYLKVVAKDVDDETDVVEWWQVCPRHRISVIPSLMANQNHAMEYPTLARIALDYLPSQASSVPCEHLFSASKWTAVDRRARLHHDKFEQLQILKFAWRGDVSDLAALNDEGEVVFDTLHHQDIAEAELDDEL